MTTTLEIQQRLQALGYDLGPAGADGVLGRVTGGAIAAFQNASGITAVHPGTIEAKTLAALFPGGDAPAAAILPWFEEARRHLGLRETAGKATNATISTWLKRLNASWGDDETPWCGTFVGWCIAATLTAEPLPANPFGARSWLAFGAPAKPQRGAVMVFSRPGSAWSGHVGFYAGEDGEAFHVLGGNQSDAVTIARIRKARLIGARWSRTAAPPSGATVAAPPKGSISSNEA